MTGVKFGDVNGTYADILQKSENPCLNRFLMAQASLGDAMPLGISGCQSVCANSLGCFVCYTVCCQSSRCGNHAGNANSSGNNYGWRGLGRYFAGATGLYRSVQAFLQSRFWVNVAKSSYFPKLSLSLSSGDKMVDKTTRADEFGGVNSPEYDGKGTDATLVLRQLVYDWGYTARH